MNAGPSWELLSKLFCHSQDWEVFVGQALVQIHLDKYFISVLVEMTISVHSSGAKSDSKAVGLFPKEIAVSEHEPPLSCWWLLC